MAKYLVDTDILIAHLRGDSGVKLTEEFLQRAIISYVTVGELYQGARNKRELRQLQVFVSSFYVDWGNQIIHKKAIALLSKYILGNGLRLNDAVIAATAIHRGLTVVTFNAKHFSPIGELRVIQSW